MDEPLLENIIEEICDRYCKFPYICKDEECLETVCKNCPTAKLYELVE